MSTQRLRLLFDLVVGGIARHADDFDVERGSAAGAIHALPDGVASEFEFLQKRLVDNRDFRSSFHVGARELTPGEERNAKRTEEARADVVIERARVRVGPLDNALQLKATHRCVAGDQANPRSCHARNARDTRQLVLDRLQCLSRAHDGVPIHCRRHAKDDDPVRVQAKVHSRDIQQALREQPRRHKQRHRQRDLRSCESHAEARGAFRA